MAEIRDANLQHFPWKKVKIIGNRPSRVRPRRSFYARTYAMTLYKHKIANSRSASCKKHPKNTTILAERRQRIWIRKR